MQIYSKRHPILFSLILIALLFGIAHAAAQQAQRIFLPVLVHVPPPINNHPPITATIERVYPAPPALLTGGYLTAAAWGNDGTIYWARRTGSIEQYNPNNGTLSPLFTVPESSLSGDHLGLLGLALSDAGDIYTAYSTDDKRAIISKFDRAGNEEIMLTIPPIHNDTSNYARQGVQTHHVPPIRYHRAPDGSEYLIVFNGDGDMMQTPTMLPQDPCSIWGKVFALRLTARNLELSGTYSTDPRGLEYEGPYRYGNICGLEDDIITLMQGVRHPWGVHIYRDATLGDTLLFGDVGHVQTAWENTVPDANKMAFEEVNQIPLNMLNPQPFNGGWPQYEGPIDDPRSTKYGGDLAGIPVWPMITLSHDLPPNEYSLYRSITGGTIVNLNGYDYYVFGDYIQNEVYGAPVLRDSAGNISLGDRVTLFSPEQLGDVAEWGSVTTLPVAFLSSTEEGEIFLLYRGMHRITLLQQ